MVGSLNESTIGSAAIAQLLPFIDHVDMDGPLLLEEDDATGIGIVAGTIIYKRSTRTGVVYKGLFSKSNESNCNGGKAMSSTRRLLRPYLAFCS